MYEYIMGSLEEQALDYVVIDLNHMGYKIKVSANTQNELPCLHSEVKLFLHQVIKEDEMALYGFATTDEREIFRTMIGISGIGPKAAIGLLSQFSSNELISHIINNDPKAISKAPGIGLKTANRIILELKDRYKDFAGVDFKAVNPREINDTATQAINGLVGLGYSVSEASEMVSRAYVPDCGLEDLIKSALRSTNPLKGR
ncbi:Holliday junction branch migration protein RuvA [Acetobacterium paludosum]|uniref:Holliday junction branch migration complex subunit RuvA n=1 Tax=Acetobacterium paludosum TaxID=52693 RepID=A0A923KX41_9FIRM|nr:Holliday junction branch migration protein RuvA [Acetobacterium paludosum]MBC3889130.1 Holliday junction branch migration protein RuvA [Acetobacterium paludosum]